MTQSEEMSTDSDSLSSSGCTSPITPLSPWYSVDDDTNPAPDCSSRQEDGHDDIDGDETVQEKSHTKLKKKVSFPPTDDELVSIREIPSRDDIPLEEELAPCDPEKLVEEMTVGVRTDSSRRYECSNRTSGRSTNLVAEITGLNVYGSPFTSRSMSKLAAKQLSQNLRKSKECTDFKATEKPASRQKKIAIKQFSTEDICDKMRVATSAKEKTNRTSKRNTGSAKREREKTKKQKSPTNNADGAVGKQKTKVYTFEPTSHRGVPKKSKERSKHVLSTDTTNVSNKDALILPDVLSPRMLSSPYKQSYGIFPEIQPRPLSSTSFGHVQTESGFIFPNDSPSHALRVRSAGNRPQEITIERPSPTRAKQKIYAWNMANGAPVETTPCIAPMWDMTKLAQTADGLKIT